MKVNFKKITDVQEILKEYPEINMYHNLYEKSIMGITIEGAIVYCRRRMILSKIWFYIEREDHPEFDSSSNFREMISYFLPHVESQIIRLNLNMNESQPLPIICRDQEFSVKGFSDGVQGSILSFIEFEPYFED